MKERSLNCSNIDFSLSFMIRSLKILGFLGDYKVSRR